MNVELLNYMGDDLTVVNAARVSFDKASTWNCCKAYDDGKHCDCREKYLCDRDKKLIAYLARNSHWTPFGHCFATFRIKAPIFVARQLGKHQVGLVWNEVSRRYVDSEPEFYVPTEWRGRADNVKQGSTDWPIEDSDWVMQRYKHDILDRAYNYYKAMLTMGVCPEQARMVLPQSMLTEWWWSGSLAAFARVCKLRLDPHTQRETASVAAKMYDELEKVFPVSWAALMENETV